MFTYYHNNDHPWPNWYDTVLFLDVDSGEEFEFASADFQYAFWQDSQHLAFLHGENCASFDYGSIINLNTGKIERYSSADLSGKDFCAPYQARYSAVVSFMESDPPITIYDNRQEIYEDFNPQPEGVINISAELSPDMSTLAVLQNSIPSHENTQFAVYDFVSKNLRGVYKVSDVSRYFQFTSDSQKIVFLDDNLPCILTLENLIKECGVPIPKEDQYKYIHLSGIANNNDIVFVHNVFPDSGFYGGGICIYGVFTGNIKCPMDDLDFMNLKKDPIESNFVSNYKFSPDEEVIVFDYGEGCPTCDYFYYEGTAVIDANGNSMYDFHDDKYFRSSYIWRPKP